MNTTDNAVILTFTEADTIERYFRIDLDAQYSTHFVFDLKMPVWANLHVGTRDETIFIKPSDDFSITFSGQNEDALKPIFGGLTPKDNRFYQQMVEKFHSNPIIETPSTFLKTHVDRPTFAQAQNYGATQFKTLVQRRFDVAMDLLYEHKSEMDRSLFSYLFRLEHYTLQSRLYSYFVFHTFKNDSEWRLARSFIPSETFAFADEQHLNEPFVAEAMKMFAHAQNKNSDAEPSKLYATIALIGKTKQTYQLLFNLLETAIATPSSKQFALQKWEQFNQTCPDKLLIQRFNELMITQGEFQAKPTLATNFDFILPDNTVRKLSDFKGKVIMLSFWATWCTPCLTNFKNTASIRHDLQKNGVILLNINLDEDINAYKEILRKLNIEGISAQPNALDQVKLAYEVNALPHYVFIDKQNRLRLSENHTEMSIQKMCTKLLNN